MSRINLTPMPGKDFKSQKEVEKAFKADKDFLINDMFNRWDGKPCNRSSLKEAGVQTAQIRYGNLRKAITVKI